MSRSSLAATVARVSTPRRRLLTGGWRRGPARRRGAAEGAPSRVASTGARRLSKAQQDKSGHEPERATCAPGPAKGGGTLGSARLEPNSTSPRPKLCSKMGLERPRCRPAGTAANAPVSPPPLLLPRPAEDGFSGFSELCFQVRKARSREGKRSAVWVPSQEGDSARRSQGWASWRPARVCSRPRVRPPRARSLETKLLCSPRTPFPTSFSARDIPELVRKGPVQPTSRQLMGRAESKLESESWRQRKLDKVPDLKELPAQR